LASAPPALAEDAPLTISLGYEGRLIFKVLDIQVEERATPSGFSAKANLSSAGILAALKHIHQRASSQGRIVAGEPRPGTFETQKLSGKTRRRIHTVWADGAVAMNADPPFDSLGEPAPSPAQKLAAADPLTELMRMTIRGSRETTCGRSHLFFDGKQLYALDFARPQDVQPSGRETRLGLTNHYRCDVTFREVAGFNRKPAGKRNQGLQRPISLDFAQVGENGPWVISALHAQTPLGWASIELSRLTVSGRLPEKSAEVAENRP
jgi:hypothetical protein